MTQLSRVLIAIATYNELENLPGLVAEIRQYAPDANIVIVDDNSPDGTGKWCDEQAAADSHFHVIHREGKLGLGTATIAGLRYAIDRNFDWVITMDADFSHQPSYIPDFIRAAHNAENPPDVVIGSRYIPGGGVQGWPLKRYIMSRCLNFYARLLLGLKPRDCSGAYRCYRVAILRKIEWDSLHSRGYSFFEELLWKLQSSGARFVEVPIIFIDRTEGRSKISRKEAWDAVRIIFLMSMKRLIGRK